MPSVGKEAKGRPIAVEYVRGTRKGKKIFKDVIYLYDHDNGQQEIESKLNVLPLFHKPKDEVQNHRVAIIGSSGSGKSYFAGEMLDIMKSRKFGDPDRKIIVYSGHGIDDYDEPIDRERNNTTAYRANLEDEDDMSCGCDDLQDCIVLFDDVEHMTDKDINNKVIKLRNELLEKGRRKNIDIISISHNPFEHNKTKMVHTESTGSVIFPQRSKPRYVGGYLDKVLHFDKDHIHTIKETGKKSRWIYISNEAPHYLVHEHGVKLLKNI